jgi:hypothetical protein
MAYLVLSRRLPSVARRLLSERRSIDITLVFVASSSFGIAFTLDGFPDQTIADQLGTDTQRVRNLRKKACTQLARTLADTCEPRSATLPGGGHSTPNRRAADGTVPPSCRQGGPGPVRTHELCTGLELLRARV